MTLLGGTIDFFSKKRGWKKCRVTFEMRGLKKFSPVSGQLSSILLKKFNRRITFKVKILIIAYYSIVLYVVKNR